MLSFIRELSVWDRLPAERRPVVLYGMGDGALKVLDACGKKGIRVAGIFASDGHVRGNEFAGFRVKRLSELEAELGDFIILLCFAAFREELLAQLEEVGRRHELLAPDVPVFGEELFDQAYLDAHSGELEAVYGMLADEQSRRVFRCVLNFKLSGKPCYLREAETPKEEVYSGILRLSRDEDYYDLGGYDGDTVREFLDQTGGAFRSVTVLEPDEKNFRKLERAAASFPAGNIRLVRAASWSRDGELSFCGKAGRSSFLSPAGGQTVPVRSVDSLSAGERVSFLKMDVEGAEAQTLLGAAETIRRWAPKLAVSAYHRSEDLFRLPLLIRSLRPDYRLFLRHQPYIPAWETNLYAVL